MSFLVARTDPYAPARLRLPAPIVPAIRDLADEREAELDEGEARDAAERAREAIERDRARAVAEVETGIAGLAKQAHRTTPQEAIAALALALTYGEMVEMAGAIGNAADGKLAGIDVAPILWAWAHKTRGAAP